RKAYPAALARRSSYHHQPAFIIGTLHQQLGPTEAGISGFCQRRRRARSARQSSNGVSVLKSSGSSAPATFLSSADSAWRTASGGQLLRDRHRHRCVSRTVQPSLGHSSGSVRALGSSARTYDSYKQETSKALAAGVDAASAESSSSKRVGEGTSSHSSGLKCGFGDDDDSPAAGLELEPLVERVASALKERCSVRSGDLVLVLVSGGSDSVALLLALNEAAKTFQPAVRVEAAHFNHALRGKDSDADEEFVAGLAHGLGVPLHVRRWKGADEGGTGGPGAGMQERARRWRRSEARDIMSRGMGLAEAGRGDGRRGFIATAHHKDDQVETVLLKALRGAHITNMQARGMAWHTTPFIRPLLEARKSDLVVFLKERRQTWREDGSNQVAKYARNRVRLQLVPLLQDLAGGPRALETRLEELSRQSLFAKEMLEREAVRWEQQYLGFRRHSGTKRTPSTNRSKESEGTAVCLDQVGGSGAGAQSPLGVRLEEFPLLPFLKTGRGPGSAGEEANGREGTGADLPELVREELLHRFVLANIGNAPLPYAQLRLLMRQIDEGGRKWSLSLGGDHHLLRIGDFLRIEHRSEAGGTTSAPLKSSETTAVSAQENGAPNSFPVAPHDSGAALEPWKIVVSPCEDGDIGSDGQCAGPGDLGCGKGIAMEESMVLFNLPAGVQLHVRRKRDGDRFQPTWRDRPVKLKDFLRGQGVPLHRRDEVALICDQHDKVIAVYPSYPGLVHCRDTTGARPIRVRIKGKPLFCPRPEDRGGVPT
ncbi:unnamed protein product, partial [Hapterophycus canaliculatus]